MKQFPHFQSTSIAEEVNRVEECWNHLLSLKHKISAYKIVDLELFNLSHFSDKTKCDIDQQISSSDSIEIEKSFTTPNSTMNNNSLQTSIESNNIEIDFFSSTPQQLGEECNLNIKNPPETFPITSTPIQISTPRTPTTKLDIINLKSKTVAVKRKKANYSNAANILIALFSEVDFVKRYYFLRKQAKNSNTHFNIKNYKTQNSATASEESPKYIKKSNLRH